MKIARTAAATAAVGALALFGGTACSDVPGVGGSDADRSAEVQSMIRSQLPDSAKRNLGMAVYVEDVTCAAKSDTEFDCFATVTGANGGRFESFDLGISATCDDSSCTWRTE
jgi:hypothetical protein